ncbi:MAG: type 1 glutamine amidotransferase [Micrococcales bacterium]|nr:type 1 glutamine amidotransferase [Micrococcales bacterium]
MPTIALTIQPDDEAPPARLEAWACAEDVVLDVVRPYLGEALPGSAAAHHGLIVLGGHMGSYDDARYPWLGATKRLIAEAIEREQPFLGVCLGHQLAAVALGGVVALRPEGPARGMVHVLPTPEVFEDLVFSALPVGSQTLQWNNDVVTELPTGATTLTTDVQGHPQTVRFGPRAWGVQCHPEATLEVVDTWIESEGTSPAGVHDLDRLRAEVHNGLPLMATQWSASIRRFFGLVQQP